MSELGDAVEGELHVCAAEEADAEADVGPRVAIETHHLCLAESGIEVLDAHLLADGEVTGGEAHLGVFLQEHLHENLHVEVADSGQRVPTAHAWLLAGWVGHEGDDARTMLYGGAVLLFHTDENDGGDEHFLNPAPFASPPDVRLVVRGGIGFKAQTKESVAHGFLCARPDKN